MYHLKYHYIVTVAEMKSISKAAKELYLSQPSLTKYINKVEEELGVKLFNRNVIPITLTHAGEQYVSIAKQIMHLERALSQEFEEMFELKKGRLTVGASSSRGEYLLPNLFPAFRKLYPGIDLRIIEGTYEYLEEHVNKGLIDVILTTLPSYSDTLDYEIVGEEEIYLAMAPDHILLEGIDLTENSPENLIYIEPQQLNGIDLINLMPGQGITKITNMMLKKYGVQPNIILETESVDTAYCLASRGMGVTFTTDLCVMGYFPDYIPALCTIEKEPIKRKSIAGFQKENRNSITIKAFIEVMRNVLATCPEYRRIPHEEYIAGRASEKTNSWYYSWLENM